MKNSLNKKIITTALSITAGLLLSLQTMANETFVCLSGSAERKISIVYDTPGQDVPCAVTYEKGDGIQTLWSAENEAGYCEVKAAEFVERQREWGWDCARLGLEY